jgi:hypothetical protein
MTKIARSGSISQRNGSADPDPQQNAMDPEHCKKHSPKLTGTTSSGLLMLAEQEVQRFTFPHRPLMLPNLGAFHTDRAIQAEQKITYPNPLLYVQIRILPPTLLVIELELPVCYPDGIRIRITMARINGSGSTVPKRNGSGTLDKAQPTGRGSPTYIGKLCAHLMTSKCCGLEAVL